MRFKPISKSYKFNPEVLTIDFPKYMRNPIASWLKLVASRQNFFHQDGMYNRYYFDNGFCNDLQVHFREEFPQRFEEFLPYVFSDSERTANILALWLQNYANRSDANSLETTLLQGGSGYTVSSTDSPSDNYREGAYDLSMRIPNEVVVVSEEALQNKLLHDAWELAYSRSPDDEKIVTKCCNFLEGYFGKKYFPKDPKPQLKKFVHTFRDKPNSLNYLGDTIIKPKSTLTDLLTNVSDIRGQHTEGSGRTPTHDEAIFVLHATIFIWNIDNGATK